MKVIKKPTYLLFNKHFLIITVLALGAVASITALSQQTQTQQQAAPLTNLNTATEIESSINSDGTMGPATARDNFSNTLPSVYLGKIVINLNDAQQKKSDNTKNASLKTSSLTLTITKAEIHLIHLFMPGTSTTNTIDEKINTTGQKTNQNVNKWEVIQLNSNTDKLNLNLTGGESAPVGVTQLAGGKYSEIRLYITKAKAKLEDGKEIALTIPGQSNIIRIVQPFNIFANKTTYLTLDLDKENSIIQSGEAYFLQPFVTHAAISN
jgi:hypothetical protein